MKFFEALSGLFIVTILATVTVTQIYNKPIYSYSSELFTQPLIVYQQSFEKYLEDNKDKKLSIQDIEENLDNYLADNMKMNKETSTISEDSFICETYSTNAADHPDYIGATLAYGKPVLYAVSGLQKPSLTRDSKISINNNKNYYVSVQYDSDGIPESNMHSPTRRQSNYASPRIFPVIVPR